MMARPNNTTFARVRRFIERNSMLQDSRGVVVAVSGGPDSVALLDILVRVRDLQVKRGTALLQLHVAHLDHRIRAEESAEDAEFVRALASRLGLDSTVEAVDVPAAARASKRGIEETARELRYGFLARTARERGLELIATGHTMSDQAETMLMRLVRGSGARGLSSMRPVTRLQNFDAVRLRGEASERESGELRASALPGLPVPLSWRPLLIRPLLCIERVEIEEYCNARGLEFRIDASNETRDYLRNRVRHDIIPLLEELNPRVVRSISRAAGILAAEQDTLEEMVRLMVDAAATEDQPSTARGIVIEYSAKAFLDQPEALRRRMILEALDRTKADRQSAMLGTSYARGPRSEQLASIHVEAVGELLNSRKSGKRIELAGGVEAWIEFDRLVFRYAEDKNEGRMASDRRPIELDSHRPSVDFGGMTLSVEPGNGLTLREAMEEAREQKSRSGRDWMIALVDCSALPDRFVVRRRRRGEQAQVVGQRGTKKLKNLMIDHRIPSSRRADWPVVTTPDGRYVWSPGLPLAKEFAVRDRTTSFAILRASTL